MPILVRTTPSTMAEVADLASAGAPEGTTVIAEEQTAGRGRIGREWQSLPYAGLWLTTLLRPAVEPSSLGWLPLVTGIAVAHAVRAQTDIDVGLKWPNDIVISTSSGLAKAGGILSERLADGSVLVGIGINVSQAPDELPPGGTSLARHTRVVEREPLVVAVLGGFADSYRRWLAGADLEGAYREMSVTIGSEVRVETPGATLEGVATGLGRHGELLVTDRSGSGHAVSAGDVLLVRPAIG